MAEIELETRDGVLRATLNRPAKRNALSRQLLAELAEAFTRAARDESLKAALLSGAGERSFAAGGDLQDLAGIRSAAGAREMAEQARAALDAIRLFPVPVVAALNGDAMGGGAELAMACDFRIAAAHARIGFVQGQLSLSTAWGGGIDLMQRLGPSAALGILGRSQMLSGGDALREGLLDAVASPGRPLDELAHEFLAPFVRQAPQVLRAFKALAIASRRGVPRSELCELEAGRFADLWVHDDHWQAVDRLVAGSRKR